MAAIKVIKIADNARLIVIARKRVRWLTFVVTHFQKYFKAI